ncbi:MAG: pyrroline-5-carboxylate reductase dimerization domain-containing protein, partial [Pseudomonadota bacterium]
RTTLAPATTGKSCDVETPARAGVSTSQLLPVVAGAKVVRIMPTIASEFGESATLVFPETPQLETFFSALGKSYVLDDEDQFEVGTVSAAIFGWAQALIMNSNDWAAKNGMNADQARQLLAQTFISAGTIIAEKDQPVAEILKSLATPGGITEAGLQHLENTQAIKAWEEASEIVLKKLVKEV